MNMTSNNRLWSEGRFLLAGMGAGAVLALLLMPSFLWVIVGFLIFFLYFFRDPERRVAAKHGGDDSLLIAPADGKVVAIEPLVGEGDDMRFTCRLSIFLSPLDVHINRVPFAGTIENIRYKKGAFMCAFLPKSSLLNERNDILLTSNDGKRSIVVRQIAGTLARRIRCWVVPHQKVSSGERYGMICFGSRVDILVPASVIFDVRVGDRVYGGVTVVGRWQ